MIVNNTNKAKYKLPALTPVLNHNFLPPSFLELEDIQFTVDPDCNTHPLSHSLGCAQSLHVIKLILCILCSGYSFLTREEETHWPSQ